MAASQYKPGEVFSRFDLQNVEKNSFSEENTEYDDGTSDNLSVESDNQVYVLQQAQVWPATTTKRKASSVVGQRSGKDGRVFS